jgi:hypothetical protein
MAHTGAIDQQTDPQRWRPANVLGCGRMRNSSDREKRLQGALAAVDDALFRTSPKEKFDVDRSDHEARASELKALNERFQQLDEYFIRAVAEIEASLGK